MDWAISVIEGPTIHHSNSSWATACQWNRVMSQLLFDWINYSSNSVYRNSHLMFLSFWIAFHNTSFNALRTNNNSPETHCVGYPPENASNITQRLILRHNVCNRKDDSRNSIANTKANESIPGKVTKQGKDLQFKQNQHTSSRIATRKTLP